MKKVLVVEDEGVIALHLKNKLEKKGYLVTGTVGDGDSAIKSVADNLPDLILMDINIKGDINGIETARRILKLHPLPVVFLTAHSDTKTLEEAKTVTPYGYLVKPFEDESLYSTIDMVIHRHQTEQKVKALELEKEKLREQLAQTEKLKTIGTMAGGIAHNFNNLLMGIQGRATLLYSCLDSTNTGQMHLESIESLVKQASHLTDQMLGLAQKGKYTVENIDIFELLKNCLTSVSSQYTKVKSKFVIPPGTFLIDGEKRQIEQVFTNLFENSCQAMSGDGKLDISLSTVSVLEDSSDNFPPKKGNYIQVSVKDTGIGMDKATRWRIFDPFFTTKGVGRGTGLGLSAAYGIITNHDGFINVTSKVGEGAIFDVFLPRSQTKVPKPIPEKIKSKNLTDKTILLIDDDVVMIEIGKAMLQKIGYRVATAQSGEEGIEVISSKTVHVDLVILDMLMPGLDGSQTFDRIRSIEPILPIMIASGYAANDEISNLLIKGASGFLQKPFSLKELEIKSGAILCDEH